MFRVAMAPTRSRAAANFAFEQAYSYPQILGGNQFAPSYDIRIEDLTSGRFNLIPDPAWPTTHVHSA